MVGEMERPIVYMCVCVRERERERRATMSPSARCNSYVGGLVSANETVEQFLWLSSIINKIIHTSSIDLSKAPGIVFSVLVCVCVCVSWLIILVWRGSSVHVNVRKQTTRAGVSPHLTAGHKNTHPSWSHTWVAGVTKRKWLLLILELQLIKETHTYTDTDTQDKEEAMLEVAVHGAMKTLVTDVFLNIKLNLFLNVAGWLASHWSLFSVVGKHRYFIFQAQTSVNLGTLGACFMVCFSLNQGNGKNNFLHSNSVCRNSLAWDRLRKSILAWVCCLSRFIKTVCQLWFRPGWRGYVDRLCTAAAFCISPCLPVFIGRLVFSYLANLCAVFACFGRL